VKSVPVINLLRLMKEHFSLEDHQSNRNIYCAYCDMKFKGTRAGELTEHRSVFMYGYSIVHTYSKKTILFRIQIRIQPSSESGLRKSSCDFCDLIYCNRLVANPDPHRFY
jgi:hypothetical protein